MQDKAGWSCESRGWHQLAPAQPAAHPRGTEWRRVPSISKPRALQHRFQQHGAKILDDVDGRLESKMTNDEQGSCMSGAATPCSGRRRAAQTARALGNRSQLMLVHACRL